MDVGNPSNMERLRNLIGEADALNERIRIYAVNDPVSAALFVLSQLLIGVAGRGRMRTNRDAERGMERSDLCFDVFVIPDAVKEFRLSLSPS